MDLFEALHTRRSIRSFTDAPVTEADLETLLRAAMAAPSAGNAQPWHFVVLDERAVLDEIPKFHPYAAMLKEAPLAIVVCGDESLQKYPDRWPQDCSAATQNILLAAHALGLGAVWLGMFPNAEREAKLGELLHLPEGVHPLSIVALGWPNQQRHQPERYKPERVHHNQW